MSSSYSMIVWWLVYPPPYLDYWVISIIQIEKTTSWLLGPGQLQQQHYLATTAPAQVPSALSNYWESYEFKDANQPLHFFAIEIQESFGLLALLLTRTESNWPSSRALWATSTIQTCTMLSITCWLWTVACLCTLWQCCERFFCAAEALKYWVKASTPAFRFFFYCTLDMAICFCLASIFGI